MNDCREELHLAANLLQLDTTALTQEMLRTLDTKLVQGFDIVQTALSQLPAIVSATTAFETQTKAITAGTEAIADLQRMTKLGDNLRHVLEWLCTANHAQQQSDFHSRRQEGTGAWILHSREFLEWAEGTASTLPCPVQPGAGKTIIAATAVNHLPHTQDFAEIATAYVFCDYKRRREQDTIQHLGALLRQLLRKMGRIPAPMQKLYDHYRDEGTRPTRRDHENLLSGLVNMFTKLYIVIHALDECYQNTRPHIIRALRKPKEMPQVNLMMTTRAIPGVLDRLRSVRAWT